MPASDLQETVFRASRKLAESGLVLGTFGNVSAVDRGTGRFAIKPSGVPYEDITPAHMVQVSLETGEWIDNGLRPSSDTPTHLALYRAFASIGGIVHTHSEYATVFAQARQPIRCMGTTHADYFRGDVPVTRSMTRAEVDRDYEQNTGRVIVETFSSAGISPDEMTAVLVANHATLGRPGPSAPALHPGDSGDAGEGLASKAQGCDPGQVGDAAELGGGVAHEGQGQILRLHAGPIVDDQDPFQARPFDLDCDPARASIDAVLNQLLDYRSGSLHHLPGCDGVSHRLVEAGDR